MRPAWGAAGWMVVLGASACLSSANLSGAPETADAGPVCTGDLQTDVGNCGSCGRVCASRANSFATCKEGKCGIECDTGFADCNNNPDDGCEVDLAKNENHCGVCGHSCMGGRCRDSACQPIVLASLQGALTSLARDETFLYAGLDNQTGAMNEDAVVRISLDGQVTEIATGLSDPPRYLAVDATHVYFLRRSTNAAGDGSVVRVPKSGGQLEQLVGGQLIGRGYNSSVQMALQVSGGFVYWANGDTAPPNPTPGRLVRCAVTGCASPTNVVNPARGVQALIVDGDTVYFSASGEFGAGGSTGRGLFRCPAAGCAAGVAISGPPATSSITQMAQDADRIYLGSYALISTIRRPGTDYATYTSSRGSVTSIVSDGGQVFWLDSSSGGALLACPAKGCDGVPTEVDLRAAPTGLVVDAKTVYVSGYTGSTGLLFRIAR